MSSVSSVHANYFFQMVNVVANTHSLGKQPDQFPTQGANLRYLNLKLGT